MDAKEKDYVESLESLLREQRKFIEFQSKMLALQSETITELNERIKLGVSK
jgi:uncharacterized coiled-coil protein SlyX